MALLNTGTTALAMAATWMEDLIVPQYEYFQSEIAPRLAQAVPQVGDVWEQMDVPPWAIYSTALRQCGSDIFVAGQSTFKVAYITLKPLAILLWVVGQFLFHVLHILARVLFAQGFVSLQKGLMQAKAGIVWFYVFQRSLSKEEVIGEIAIGALLVLSYYSWQWMKRQTYVTRLAGWYRKKKKKVIDFYTKTVDRLAQVSVALAMAIPHGMFVGVCLGFKVFFPRVLTWLAADTYATALLTIWYPLISTIAWIHNYHSFQKQQASVKVSSPRVQDIRERYESQSPKSGKAGAMRSGSQPSYLKQTAAQRSREKTTKSQQVKTGFYPRTSPAKKSPAVSKTQQSTSLEQPQQAGPIDPTEYWLQYWVIYATVHAVGRAAYLIPIIGRFVTKHPMVLAISVELKLVFFIWLFGMEQMLSQVVDAQQPTSILVQTLPRNLLHKHGSKLLMDFHSIVSEAVSKDTWDKFVVSKSKSIIELLVMIKVVSEPFKDWVVHMLEEGRSLVLPSISLLMPGFITQFGLVYVQYLLPSAKSLIFHRPEQGQGNAASSNDERRLLYLKYWVMHSLWSACLSYFDSLLWWIPFSTHVIYLTWCHLSFPNTIQAYYKVLESELIGFGLLRPREEHGDVVLDVHETKTAKLLKNLSKRLPSAASDYDERETKDNLGGPALGSNDREGGDPSTQPTADHPGELGAIPVSDSNKQDIEPDLLMQVNSEELSSSAGGLNADDDFSAGEVEMDAGSDENSSPLASTKKNRVGRVSLQDADSSSEDEVAPLKPTTVEGEVPVRRSTRKRRSPTERTNF